MNDHRSENLELPKYYEEDDPKLQEENQIENDKNKRVIIAASVGIGILVLALVIFLAIFFSSKKKDNGGSIKVVHKLDEQDEVQIFNVNNLKKDEYEIEKINLNDTYISSRLLEEEYSENNGKIKFNNNHKRTGIIECKIKFKTFLTKIDSMFKDINTLKDADLSELVSEKVKSMNSLFLNCENLENINFGKFNSKKVESMDNTFENCINLYQLDLSSFETPKLKSLKSAFKNCGKLEYLDLNNFELNENIVERDDIFSGTNLQYIKIKDEETKQLLYSESPNNNITNNTGTYIPSCEVGENEKCKNCDNSNKCTCNEGYYLPSYLTRVNKCKTCSEGCKNCIDDNNCNICNDKYTLINKKCVLIQSDTTENTVSADTADTTENTVLVDTTDTTENTVSADTADTTENTVLVDTTDTTENTVSAYTADTTENTVLVDTTDTTENTVSADTSEINTFYIESDDTSYSEEPETDIESDST